MCGEYCDAGKGNSTLRGGRGEKSFRIKLVGGHESKTKKYRGLHFLVITDILIVINKCSAFFQLLGSS